MNTRPRFLPVHLEEQPSRAFDAQLSRLHSLTPDLVDWAAPRRIDADMSDADAVVIPDLSGQAYRLLEAFTAIQKPILLVTSEFGTVSMWDWEIRDYLRRRGVPTIAPTSRQEYVDLCRAIAFSRELASSRMLAYQDDLGAGQQPDIFKRFYWWEQECVRDLEARFGVEVQHRSYRALAARASSLPQFRVDDAVATIAAELPMDELAPCARNDAVRLYLALDDEIEETGSVIAAGINCLNESESSTTTPCLAFNLLFERRGILWGCEADLSSMLTEALLSRSLDVPVMMTNLYPFLMGQAALKHEGIPSFPEVDEPENHVLVAHCGYFGEIPVSCAADWACRPPVLEIVDSNAHAIDARFPEGPVTLVKIASDMQTLAVTPAELLRYVQYEDSDCLNGGVLRIEDGYRFVESLPSHHTVVSPGDIARRTELVASALGLGVERI